MCRGHAWINGILLLTDSFGRKSEDCELSATKSFTVFVVQELAICRFLKAQERPIGCAVIDVID